MIKIVALVTLILLGVSITYWRQQSNTIPEFYTSANPNFGFDECVKTGGKVSDTYPKRCQTSDLVTYFQDKNAPIDTSKWKRVNTDLGFSFLCPEYWDCKKFEESSYTLYNPNYSISNFQINLITPNNFQESFLRHSGYKAPLAWYEDVRAKKPAAVKTLKQDIQSVPGTDGFIYPEYAGYNLDQMIVREASKGGGLVFLKDENDANILIPLNETDLILITVSPNTFYENPAFQEIIRSIKAE